MNLIKRIITKFSTERLSVNPVVSKRFPFGETLEYKEKTYRYLYSCGEDDVLLRDDDEPNLVLIKSKYIVTDDSM